MSSLADASKTPAGLNVTVFTPDLRPAWMRKTPAGAPRPFQDVPVVVLSATRGFPRQFRAHWTGLQKDLAAPVPRGRHLVIGGSGHRVHQDRPDAVANAILQVIVEIRASQAQTSDIPARTSRPLPHAFPADPPPTRRLVTDCYRASV